MNNLPGILPASWSVIHRVQLPAREAGRFAWDDLALTPETSAYLRASAKAGIFGHQHDAIRASLDGNDVCLATPTASGKSLAFQAAAIERLAKDPDARVLAIYPMKALGHEQEARWRRALETAGIGGHVMRLDGSVQGSRPRLDACQNARVIIATPDVIHAWLLPRLGQERHQPIATFLGNVALVVVDEVHSYSGVFGTNAAFLFRRLQHAMDILGARPAIVAASATMKNPADHLDKLFGRSFVIIGAEADTSPRHAVEVVMVKPPRTRDFSSEMCELFEQLVNEDRRFIAFFDSRKSTEQMGSAMLRGADAPEGEGEGGYGHLSWGKVLPYRAGYEAEHREHIQARLTDGSLHGILSTSALELGLDIPGLEVAVLVGVPSSGTSLTQRMGRVGRSGPGVVIVVHSGTVVDDVVFAEPDTLMRRPLTETAIYLESERVQYIHAMALAGVGCEHDRAHRVRGTVAPSTLSTSVAWPEGFERLCHEEREGRVASHLREMKREADSQPTLTLPLRDAEQQFEVEVCRGPLRDRLGSLSWNQVMREAYPGAVYYYTGQPFRVTGVDLRSRKVRVMRTKRYTTQPMPVATRLTPQPLIHRSVAHGDLILAECDLQIWRAVLGYRERRGSVADNVRYPSNEWSRDTFSRTLFTTGVCLAHPSLDAPGVNLDALARLLHEAFLAVVPLDRQDIEVADDTLRATWGPIDSGRRYLALHDQTFGSLRLSGRLMDGDSLRKTLEVVCRLAEERDAIENGPGMLPIGDATRHAARELLRALDADPVPDVMQNAGAMEDGRVRVLMPTSRGRSDQRPGATFEVHGVFNRPNLGVCYRGVWIDDASGTRTATVVEPVPEIQPGADPVVWGAYDPDTGEATLVA